jgi:hypothetical protein
MRHPLAEMLQPRIILTTIMSHHGEKQKHVYQTAGNFASDFFALRDLEPLTPLIEEWEFAHTFRKIVFDDNYYFHFWVYNNSSKNWYYKIKGDKVYF